MFLFILSTNYWLLSTVYCIYDKERAGQRPRPYRLFLSVFYHPRRP
jgi:hypothetical protein